VVALVIVLVVTNLLTLAALAALVRRSRTADLPNDATEVFAAPRPAGISGRERRLITVEILNPIELATARGGRVAGLAGTLAPGLTRRLVYEQTLRVLRRELGAKDVLADVRVHTLRAVPQHPEPGTSHRPDAVVEGAVIDQVAPLDLGDPPA
jgi:hypothetical protein